MNLVANEFAAMVIAGFAVLSIFANRLVLRKMPSNDRKAMGKMSRDQRRQAETAYSVMRTVLVLSTIMLFGFAAYMYKYGF